MNHDAVTDVVTKGRTIPYGTGIWPNPYFDLLREQRRKHQNAGVRQLLTNKINALIEPRFITAPETSEFIEALITMTDSRRILEVGVCTGFTTLHMLRAVYGKQNAHVMAIDARPAHDQSFFDRTEFRNVLFFKQGWTPEVFKDLNGIYDFVFVDSDHSIEHTQKELAELWRITRKGTVICFHDVPEWQTPTNRTAPPIRDWLLKHGELKGLCLPSCEQLDCLDNWGPGYPKECNPGLGVFVRV